MAKYEVLTSGTTSTASNPPPTPEEIAVRAHEIFLERGATPGHDVDDWLQAEVELAKKRTNGVPVARR